MHSPCAAAVFHHLTLRRHPAILGPALAPLPPRRRAALWGHLLLHWQHRAGAFYAFASVLPLRRPAPAPLPVETTSPPAPRRRGRPPGPHLAALYGRLDEHIDLLRKAGLHMSRIRLLSALAWHLPASSVRMAVEAALGIEPAAPLRLRPQTMEAYQRQIVHSALRRHGWNVSGAATELGVSRRSMYNWIARYGLARTAPASPAQPHEVGSVTEI